MRAFRLSPTKPPPPPVGAADAVLSTRLCPKRSKAVVPCRQTRRQQQHLRDQARGGDQRSNPESPPPHGTFLDPCTTQQDHTNSSGGGYPCPEAKPTGLHRSVFFSSKSAPCLPGHAWQAACDSHERLAGTGTDLPRDAVLLGAPGPRVVGHCSTWPHRTPCPCQSAAQN